MDGLVERPDANAHVGALWVQGFAVRREWRRCERKLLALKARGETVRSALVSLVKELASAKEKWRFCLFLRRHRQRLRDDDLLWGTVIEAFAEIGWFRRGARWGLGWDRRTSANPSAVMSLVRCFRSVGRDKEALWASRWAVTRPPSPWIQRHHLWLAFEAALSGEAGEAEGWVARGRETQLDAYDQFVLGLVRAVLVLSSEPKGGSREVFEEARKTLHRSAHEAPSFRDLPDLRRAYLRCARRIAGFFPGPRAFAWILGRKLSSWGA